MHEIAVLLRAAERETGGLTRDRWGHAAANAEAAALTEHPRARRWFWATACDYAQRASEAATQDEGHPRR